MGKSVIQNDVDKVNTLIMAEIVALTKLVS